MDLPPTRILLRATLNSDQVRRLAVVVIALLAWTESFLFAAPAPPDFARDIRPIFERSCFGCHGPEKQRSSYRLDVRDIALKGGDTGKPAIIPHNAKASPLIHYVSGEDDDMVMPPRKSQAKRLSPEEIQMLRDWIDAGPVWPDALAGKSGKDEAHWSLQPLVRPPVPPAADRVAAKSANPIDRFIQAALIPKKLTPSPEADRRALLRRVTFDLTGLPPTLTDVESFERDTGKDAYEKRVDQLLDSPRYGERWARHWLDTIHFADSHGYEHDLARDNAWRFRDYVIQALNHDTHWDRFIREQLAADVFFPDQPQLTAALGFLGAGTFDMSTYSTAPVTFDYLDRDDMVTQTMAAFVSTTANCARCHAHKFDPISQEDYYALQADFAGVLKGDIAYDADPAVARKRRQARQLLLAVEQKDAKVLLASEQLSVIESWAQRQGRPVHWEVLKPETFLSSDGSVLTVDTNHLVRSSGLRPERDTYTVTASVAADVGAKPVTALRLDVLADDRLPMHGPGRQDNGNLHLSEIEIQLFAPGQTNARLLKIRRATADFNQTGWGIERTIDGDAKTAWGIFPNVGQSHHAVFEFSEAVAPTPGARLAVVLRQNHGGGHLIGTFQLAVTRDDTAHVEARSLEVEAALARTSQDRTTEQRLALAAIAIRQSAEATLSNLPTPSLVYAAGASVDIISGDPPKQAKSLPTPKVVHVLNRGQFDKPGEVAQPGALSALRHRPSRFALKESAAEGERRAALADWIADTNNILTWRSVVNRVWHYHFGRGLCDTPSDFGRMGGTPSHPQLLDWLAVWFRDEAHGSLKQLHRLIVTSATYRQSAQHREACAAVDGDNRLLWRQNRYRLDADSYHDAVLAVSDTLDLKMGGPAVQQFRQSKGPQATPALDYTVYDWSQPTAHRRSIYRFVWRGIPDPFMDALDFPDLGLLAPTRGFSASSLQALTLYNNSFVLYGSERMAAKVMETANADLELQVKQAVQRTWLRAPTVEERREFMAFAQKNGMDAFCRLLLNSNEFLFVD